MTIFAFPPRDREYLEDGATTVFAVPFEFDAPEDLRVARRNGDGVETVLTRGTHYTVSGGAFGTGSVTTLTANNGQILVIQGIAPARQPTAFADGEAVRAATLEAAVDRQALIGADTRAMLLRTAARSVMVPPGEVAAALPPAAARRGGKLFGFDPLTGAFQVRSTSDLRGAPGSPGEGYASYEALADAGDTAIDRDDAYLTDPDFAGKFVFEKPSDPVAIAALVAKVAADDGRNYIPATADPTGAAGAWVRQLASSIGNQAAPDAPIVPVGSIFADMAVTPEQYRAVGDATDGATGTDDTAAILAAKNTGRNVYFSRKYILAAAITPVRRGQKFYGPGTIFTKEGLDVRAFFVEVPDVVIEELTLDGSATAPNPGPLNDMVRFQEAGASGGRVKDIYIPASQGGGVRFDGAPHCKVRDSTILNVENNSILICNAGADFCQATGNICIGTNTGNNIFTTASDGSQPTTDRVYNPTIADNFCLSAYDTGIEIGLNTYDAIVRNNYCTGSRNPPLLIRDAKRTQLLGNKIRMPDLEDQDATASGIALVPQYQGSSFEYDAKLSGNEVYGRAARSMIYIDGRRVDIQGGSLIDDVTNIGSDGAGLVGRGVALASGGQDVTINDVRIENIETPIELNIAADARTCRRINITNNTIIRSAVTISGFNCTVLDSEISNNHFSIVRDHVLELASAIYAGELRYFNNTEALTGFTGADPVSFNPLSAARLGLMTEPGGGYLIVPENDGDFTVIATADEPTGGMIVLRLMDNSQYGTFISGGRPGIGTGATIKLSGTAGLLPNSTGPEVDGLVLAFNGTNDLGLKRQGNSGVAGPRYFKVKQYSEG